MDTKATTSSQSTEREKRDRTKIGSGTATIQEYQYPTSIPVLDLDYRI